MGQIRMGKLSIKKKRNGENCHLKMEWSKCELKTNLGKLSIKKNKTMGQTVISKWNGESIN